MSPSLGSMPIDLQSLLETRMLIQANSGGGKSHALRRVLEQTAPLVQQLVIDPEGEFATLRERFDYIICAPSGADAVATPKTAAALAVSLWRSGSSAVIDIYELQKHERVLFVRRFLEALTAAPKSAWKPAIVALDEIQDYCPEAAKAESAAAVVDIAARGRKRGLCLLGATQRIARLSKDCAAEMLNKAIGRTGMDVDVKRAMAELGMSNYREAFETLRNLEAGEFFAYGPALSKSVERTRIGAVLTTHPHTGQRALTAPPPASKAVLASLAKLEGIQREVQDEAKTVESLAAEVTALRRKLTLAEKAAAGHGVPEADVARRIAAAVASAAEVAAALAPSRALVLGVEKIAAGLQAVQAELAGVPAELVPRAASVARTPRQREAAAAPGPVAAGVTAPQQRVLDSLAALRAFGLAEPEKETLAAHAGVPHTSGGYRNNLSALRTAGLIEYPSPGTAALTDAGVEKANAPSKAPTLADLHEAWLRIVTNPQRAILAELIGVWPAAVNKEDLARRVGVPASSGGYRNNLSRLRTMRALDYPTPGSARAAAVLFPHRG